MPEMMALGNFRFSIDTAAYGKLRRTTAYRWEAQMRMGREPALQFAGLGEETIDLAGTIRPEFRGGLGQLDSMRASAGQGGPLLLSSGRGDILGFWVIRKVTETQSTFLPGGAPLRVDFSLSLGRYGEDAAEARA